MSAIQMTVDPIRAESHSLSWAEANQACLVLEFTRLRQKLQTASARMDDESYLAELDRTLQQLREPLDPPPAIDQLCAILGLSSFERETLLLCAGIEMDSTLATLCNEALGREQRGAATSITFSLALATLVEPHWSALAPSAPLRRYDLVELESSRGLTSAALRIDERLLHYLAGVNLLDARLEPLLQRRSHPDWIAEEQRALATHILIGTDTQAPDMPLLHLCGDDPRGQEDIAALIAEQTGRHLFVLPIENIPAAGSSDPGSIDATQFIALWSREAALLPALLMVQCGANSLSTQAAQMIERLPGPLIVASPDAIRLERRALRYVVDKPQPNSQRQLWTRALELRTPLATNMNGLLDDLAEQFRLSAETIASVGASTPLSGATAADATAFWDTCRSLSRPRLETLASRILPAADWDDLILPEAQVQTLRQLTAQARHRMTVYESWGFASKGRRGLGITALFAGASGTGKTLAAEVVAKELRLDLYRIDLSAVVSKYIGESEKNLRQVFDAAEEGGVLLLFDEADALFGKRAEVKDSHDRYANIEVSYLLQRMEDFQGIAILTTNLKSSLDKAFQRRLRFIVDFPFPDAREREAIWQRVFPAQAPTSNLDIKRLSQLNMTGGNIRNIALNAAFLAAEGGSPIQMTHLLQATRQESIKTERPLSDVEMRGWA